MNAPFRPAVDEMVVVRVPMSRATYKRLLAEAIMLEREPAQLMREILVTAFNSGDLSSLRSADPAEDGIRSCISSVASEPQATRKPK